MTRTDHVFDGDDAGVDDHVTSRTTGFDDRNVGVVVGPDCVCEHVANGSLRRPNDGYAYVEGYVTSKEWLLDGIRNASLKLGKDAMDTAIKSSGRSFAKGRLRDWLIVETCKKSSVP